MFNRSSPRTLIVGSLILITAALMILNAAGFLQPVQSLLLRPVAGVQTWIAVRYTAIRDLFASPRDVLALREEIQRDRKSAV